MMPKVRISQVISVVLFVLIVVIGVVSRSITSRPGTAFTFTSPEYKLVQPVPVPFIKDPENASQAIYSPSIGVWQGISSQAVLVIDVPSASVLLQKNPEMRLYPASTAKMMTALVARDSFQSDTLFTVKEEAYAVGTRLELQLNEQFILRELLFGLLLHSGNDAAFVLANNHPEGYAGFVQAMNEKGAELGLEQTHFSNPSGLDSETQVTSARDLGVIAREVLKDPMLKTIVGTKEYVMTDVTGRSKYPLYNTHQLVHVLPEVKGIKTGTTDKAGEVLVTYVEKDDRQLMLIVAGSEDRYADTRTLLDWVIAQYSWKEIVATQ